MIFKKLCGSKYLQANLGRTFQSVKKDLENDLVVLFSGTGCYVNGLETFLSKKYDNLICIDVVCHGVPSPKLWREYAKFQESKHGKLEQINLRAKEEGWKKFGMKENHLYIPREKDHRRPCLQGWPLFWAGIIMHCVSATATTSLHVSSSARTPAAALICSSIVLVAGLTASGADAYLLHVTTTPSVAYIARVDDFDLRHHDFCQPQSVLR